MNFYKQLLNININGMDIVYQEKVPTNKLISLSVGASVFGFGAILLMMFNGRIESTFSLRLILGVGFAFLLVVFLSFRDLQIVVTTGQIIFGFGWFKRKFGLGHIESVRIDEYKFANYWGYGIRYGRDGSIGYAPRGGEGIRIKFAQEKREYFLSTGRAEELKNLLGRYAKG